MVLIDGHTKPHDGWLRPIVKLLREVRRLVTYMVPRSIGTFLSSELCEFAALSKQNYKRLINMEVGLLDPKTWLQTDHAAIGTKAGFTWGLLHFWEVRLAA